MFEIHLIQNKKINSSLYIDIFPRHLNSENAVTYIGKYVL